MKLNRCLFYLVLVLSLPVTARSQKNFSYAQEMGNTAMTLWKDSLAGSSMPAKWSCGQSMVLRGIAELWNATGNGKYFEYLQRNIDFLVNEKGDARTYKLDNFTPGNIAPAREVLLLYNVTGEKKYIEAVQTLRKQLSQQPRANEDGLRHKKDDPNQMWAGEWYRAEPFYTEYANTFHEDSDYNNIAQQLIIMEKQARDPGTGLLSNGFDESKEQKQAQKQRGISPNFWASTTAWYGMALVDVLEQFPDDKSQKKELILILQRFAAAIKNVQDPKTGLWRNILNSLDKQNNYADASTSCMFVYVLAKGARLGYLPESYLVTADKGYRGIIKNFIKRDANGQLNLIETIGVPRPGGHPCCDGSYDYHVHEKVVENDPKGIGAFILASVEIEMLPTAALGKGKTVLLDNYFNHETKKDAMGKTITWHYVWDEKDNGGYSMFANVFHRYGVSTKTLHVAPTIEELKAADIYIIADPDTKAESEHPNYIGENDIHTIYGWVKGGGVLLLFGNDSGNAEFTHFNQLASRFGIVFNYDSRNKETGTNFEMAAVPIPPHTPVFNNINKVYIKEYSSLTVKRPAFTILRQKGADVIAVARVGRGTVFAVGDPWFYNEYEDGRKIPLSFQNYKASEDLVRWAVMKINKQ
ncbi:MAG TPA: glycoside hydrolase family 88 protein [Chitinophagaceae bacterium]|nr:glycoside hydrolase family 88 protein [Chitinophagaceae bacterium]